jgi:hypothetical protein
MDKTLRVLLTENEYKGAMLYADLYFRERNPRCLALFTVEELILLCGIIATEQETPAESACLALTILYERSKNEVN